MPAPLKSFAATDRFVAEIATPALRPGYVLIGDEVFAPAEAQMISATDPRSAALRAFVMTCLLCL